MFEYLTMTYLGRFLFRAVLKLSMSPLGRHYLFFSHLWPHILKIKLYRLSLFENKIMDGPILSQSKKSCMG